MVGDLDRSWKFYTETLGLEPGKRWDDHYATVKAPGLEIGLHPGLEDGPRDGYCISLGTKDIQSTMAALKVKGIEAPINDDGPQRAANFHDPDGHPIHLREDWG